VITTACNGNDKEILFGQSASLSGHLGLYGNFIKDSINACFYRINESGGINGKTLKLISMEDYGDPELTKRNITHMMEDKKIDMFLGCTGTRSITAVLPLIKNEQIAMFFPWGGDANLRNPNLKNIINGLGYLNPQIEEIAEYVVSKKRINKIAVFHADDNFSTHAANHLIQILKQQYGITPIEVSDYNRLTVNIERKSETLLASDPKVVICIATSMPTAKLISRFFEQGHYGTEFIGIDSTLFVSQILKDKGAHFYYSSCVPNPVSDTIKIAQQYRNDMQKYYPEDSFNILSFAFYISARIIVEAIKKTEFPLNKEKIIHQIEQMQNFDLDGFNISFDKTTRHAFGKEISIIKTY
jgi:ABC-type branched-subunit amino acid transport system substrate-binding protein